MRLKQIIYYLAIISILLSFSTFKFTDMSQDDFSLTALANINSISSSVDLVGADILHSLGYTGSGVKIGIIDTGLDSDHSEFSGRIITERNFVLTEYGYSSDATTTEDVDGHGTWVAGIAAGSTIGIAPDAELISAKIFHSSIAGNNNVPGEETYQAVVAAIDYCVNESVDIINLSFGQYYNLPDEIKQQAVNYAVSRGVVAVVAAGNEGVLDTASGSIGNPSTAIQDICVAASYNDDYIASFSSTGPKSDYSMKPDITAPGVSIVGADLGGGLSSASGTSASSPIIAGAAALLIDALKSNGIDYNPSVIKAALMDGAFDLGYPVWQQGAGFVNVSRSWEILQSSSLVNNIPNIFYVHTDSYPYYPIDTLFLGQELYFNTTIVSPFESYYNVEIDESIENIVKFSSFTANYTTLVPLVFDIPEDILPGIYQGEITINDSKSIIINVNVKIPKGKILFDETHNLFTHYPHYPKDSFGETTFLYGFFLEFFHLMTQYDFLVQPCYSKHYSNLTELLNYDLLILANPATNLYDSYTDWLNSSMGSYNFINYELNTLESYVKDYGGNILLLSQSPETTNYDILNNLTNRFGILFDNNSSMIYGQAAVENEFYEIDFTHYGIPLITQDSARILAKNDGQTAAALTNYSSGGNFIAISSSYWISNFGLTDFDGNFNDNIEFLMFLMTLMTPSKLNIVTPIDETYEINDIPNLVFIALELINIEVYLNNEIIEIENNSALPISDIGTYNVTIIGNNSLGVIFKDTIIFTVVEEPISEFNNLISKFLLPVILIVAFGGIVTYSYLKRNELF